jgi:N4-gp56 family major capsid protein
VNFTDTSTLTKTVREMYNQTALFAFQPQKQFLGIAQERATEVAGAKSVVFTIYSSLSPATGELGETADAGGVTPAVTQREVALKEYGNFIVSSEKLRKTSFGAPEREQATLMGFNAGESLDLLARVALDAQTGATWVGFAGAASGSAEVTIGDELTAADFRRARAKLAAANVPPLEGGYYVAVVHPHILKDLLDETGGGALRTPAEYSGRVAMIPGEVGVFEGFRIVESSNADIQLMAGAGTTTSAVSADVYTTYFVGSQALGFARHAEVPVPDIRVKEANPDSGDVLGRLSSIGWYALCGIAALRDEACFKVFSSSSLAANGS